MRNLRKLRHRALLADSAITASCWDASTDDVLLTYGPTASHPELQLVRVQGWSSLTKLTSRLVASWPVPSPSPDVAADTVVSLHNFDGLATCIVLAGGDIILVQEDGDGSHHDHASAHIEVVGSVDAGITAARWSPDEELLCMATAAGTVVFMSRGFDGTGEATMAPEDLSLSKHVSVGWGKKETQFRGKGAKAAALRDPTIPEKVDQGLPSAHDDGSGATISWRGDGAFVAVNTAHRGRGERRVVRVYSRDAVLDSVSEPCDGLEGALSWRPAGNLLAGIQRWEGKARVVFFERNGLRHGEFDLRLLPGYQDKGATTAKPIRLEWNLDSTVLAVLFAGAIQLWTMGNYHWYLKQELTLEAASLPSVVWHPEKAAVFAASASDRLVLSEYDFVVARGGVVPPHDYGAVAVIDGEVLKLSPFRMANVPPPMSLFDLPTGSAIVDVSFRQDSCRVAVLHENDLDLYSWEQHGGRFTKPKLLAKALLGPPQLESTLRSWRSAPQIAFCGDAEIYILCINEDEHGDEQEQILSYEVEDNDTATDIRLKYVKPWKSMFSLVPFNHGPKGVLGQEISGRIVSLRNESSATDRVAATFPMHLPWAEGVSFNEGDEEEEDIVFGLARNCHLYANSRLLDKSCTSFLVTRDHLIYTTLTHFVKFVELDTVDRLQIPPDNPEIDSSCRNIERGARLVTAVPSTMSLVLQMPRGNLETIYPRALVLAEVRKLIDAKDYRRAFAVCRTQRVDMNILYDHSPAQFLASVGLFLDQLEDPTYIDLFLSSLKEEDVTNTIYRESKRSELKQFVNGDAHTAKDEISGERDSKVNRVCDAVLEALNSRKDANLQNIITANVCKDPPALDDGLRVVAKMLQEDESKAERAAEHICFLADANKIYDHALGLYNLDLVVLVAQRSQRDPREYLPFVQKLQDMPELRRRFVIDDHLSKWEKALEHLKALDLFDEVRSYTTKHKLYHAALRLYRYDEARLRDITALYAVHLESVSDFRQAGLAYESLGNFAKATDCYRAAGPSCWRECLAAAQIQMQGQQQQQQHDHDPAAASLSDLASTLADALLEAKDYSAAATLQLEYLAAPAAAVRSLCKGYDFAEAMRIATSRGGAEVPDLLASAFDPGLVDVLSSCTEFLADCRAQLQAQVPRVLELRARAAADPLAFYEGDPRGDVPDDVSVVSTAAGSTMAGSLFTRYTGGGGGRSTTTADSGTGRRNRRREEKKRARGRKGTVYEEEYLVNSVRRLVERVSAVARPEVERLVFALARRGMAERACAVEVLLAEVLDGCRAAVARLWPPEPPAAAKGVNGVETVARPGELSDVRPEQPGPGEQQPPPVVQDFARLSLLG